MHFLVFWGLVSFGCFLRTPQRAGDAADKASEEVLFGCGFLRQRASPLLQIDLSLVERLRLKLLALWRFGPILRRRPVRAPEQAAQGSHRPSPDGRLGLRFCRFPAVSDQVCFQNLRISQDIDALQILVVEGDGAPAIERKEGGFFVGGAPIAFKGRRQGPRRLVVA